LSLSGQTNILWNSKFVFDCFHYSLLEKWLIHLRRSFWHWRKAYRKRTFEYFACCYENEKQFNPDCIICSIYLHKQVGAQKKTNFAVYRCEKLGNLAR
jgi:hypothetical protein